ncbi:MAG: hypothetical protein ACFFG0_41940 [Candidatus Thorarchaeota archaeon]
MRPVVNAILYINRTVANENLSLKPIRLSRQYVDIFDYGKRMVHRIVYIRKLIRIKSGRKVTPTAGIIDSQKKK